MINAIFRRILCRNEVLERQRGVKKARRNKVYNHDKLHESINIIVVSSNLVPETLQRQFNFSIIQE